MQNLICNFKTCQKEIVTVGFVTTCSHIFCQEHFDALQRNRPDAVDCPACGTLLQDPPRDIFETRVNPSEKFKTMILAGLSPAIIFEITQRGLQFWQYQQHHRENQREEEINRLRESLQTMNELRFAHERKYEYETNKHQARMNGLEEQLSTAKSKNESLIQAMADKTRELMRLQNKYEDLRKNVDKTAVHKILNRNTMEMSQGDLGQPAVRPQSGFGPFAGPRPSTSDSPGGIFDLNKDASHTRVGDFDFFDSNFNTKY